RSPRSIHEPLGNRAPPRRGSLRRTVCDWGGLQVGGVGLSAARRLLGEDTRRSGDRTARHSARGVCRVSPPCATCGGCWPWSGGRGRRNRMGAGGGDCTAAPYPLEPVHGGADARRFEASHFHGLWTWHLTC